jgi:hypothetical protein
MGMAADQSSVLGTGARGILLSRALQNEVCHRQDLLSHLRELQNTSYG